jgi:hypothetical protein
MLAKVASQILPPGLLTKDVLRIQKSAHDVFEVSWTSFLCAKYVQHLR